MTQRYPSSSQHPTPTCSSSCSRESYVGAAATQSPLSVSHPAGLGLSFYTSTMAMPQTQGPGPAHALSYLSRPMWDPTSTLMLDTNTESDEMERGKSWEEAYDPFSHFHITDSSGNDHLLFPTPVSQSGPYQRLSPMPSQIPQSMPSSQAGSYSSASYPSSESYRFERAGSLFSQQSVKMEDPLDWTSNSQPEFPPRGTSTEPELFISPGVIYDPRSVVQSPAPQESRLPTPSGSGLGKHGRDDAFMEQSPRLTIEESKRGTTKRRRTPRENANWLCDICDMPFERPYNLKAHLETHDPNRQKPFKCEHEGCSREFVRKTDLTRHVQSVHVKSKDWVCVLCDQGFARKDTLRRHEEDGCSKRFDLKHREPPQKSVSRSSTHSSPPRQGRSLTEEAAVQLSQLSAPSLVADSPRQPTNR